MESTEFNYSHQSEYSKPHQSPHLIRDPLETRPIVQVLGEVPLDCSLLLTPAALQFIGKLHRAFAPTRDILLNRRKDIQEQLDAGVMPTFLDKTREIREADWTVASIPYDLLDRRVEITGPVDRKMVINALNSGAQVYMADFEDSHSPTWRGTLEGQINLYDAVRETISYESPEGKTYQLNEQKAVLVVRPRGWHLLEKNVTVDGELISASLFDFGLFFFHNAKELMKRGSRPYFYLPKLENHLEARLWNDVFVFAQRLLEIPQGTIRATVLIETILAAFEMDEILYELRDHCAGLNCGRWDYIFSFIKKFRSHSQFVLPDRSQVTMNVHFLKSYCQLLIQNCHRRRIHAMGGMAAQIPIKNNTLSNAKAMEKVIHDKKREVNLGHDGTWVAHPGLVELARFIFDEGMQGPNQISRPREDWKIKASDLLSVPSGESTEAGLRTNVQVSLIYLESWLRGSGCVPIHHLMEDAATVEISRAQIWQWIRHGHIQESDFFRVLTDELEQIRMSTDAEKFESGQFKLASELLIQVVTGKEFVEFITLPAYSHLR
jgi:malate synthase